HPTLHSFPTRRSSDLRSRSAKLILAVTPPPFVRRELKKGSGNRSLLGVVSTESLLACELRTQLTSYHQWRGAVRQLARLSHPRRSEEHTSELQSRFDL